MHYANYKYCDADRQKSISIRVTAWIVRLATETDGGQTGMQHAQLHYARVHGTCCEDVRMLHLQVALYTPGELIPSTKSSQMYIPGKYRESDNNFLMDAGCCREHSPWAVARGV